MLGGVGGLELLSRQGEHAGEVRGDVAVADHHRALAREVELEFGEVGVSVVPGDEGGGRMAPLQVLAGDTETAVGGRAVGVDHGVVALGELGGAHVTPDLDVAEETEALARRRLLVDADHRLDLRVVGRDARPHQPEGRRQAVEDVDLDGGALLPQQVLGRVEARRPGADDRHAQGVARGSGLVAHEAGNSSAAGGERAEGHWTTVPRPRAPWRLRPARRGPWRPTSTRR